MPFITIKDLYKTYTNGEEETIALNHLSLTIQKGDFITIVGGNGAGKSTFLNALAGSFPLNSGKIIIGDTNITPLREHERARYISRVFQNAIHGTAPRMSVEENMGIALKKLKKRGLKKSVTLEQREQFRSALASLNLGLEERLNDEMGVLSGGQRQAIALLMATITLPELLLLDEHTSALDPKMQQNMMALTEKIINGNGLTTLMITHNVQDALRYGNRLIVLSKGTVIKEFNAEEKAKLSIQDIYGLYE